MRAVVQRVSRASVSVGPDVSGAIGRGLLVLLGIEHSDDEKAADYLANKVVGLRIFADSEHKMNLSVRDIGGEALVVSQFTLYGDCRKGNRPNFERAARPEQARSLYEYFVKRLAAAGIIVRTGVFQAMMHVELVNDGPVTIICESPSNS